jgi:hypothetical protein
MALRPSIRAAVLREEGIYLRLLVAEVRFTAKEVLLKGSYTALAHAVGQSGTLAAAGVPIVLYRDGSPTRANPGTGARSFLWPERLETTHTGRSISSEADAQRSSSAPGSAILILFALCGPAHCLTTLESLW